MTTHCPHSAAVLACWPDKWPIRGRGAFRETMKRPFPHSSRALRPLRHAGARSAVPGMSASGHAISPRGFRGRNPLSRHRPGGTRTYAKDRIQSRKLVSHAPSFHPPSWPVERLVWKGHGPESPKRSLAPIRRHPRRRLAHPVRVCLKFNGCAVASGPALIDFDLIAWDDEDDPRGNVQPSRPTV